MCNYRRFFWRNFLDLLRLKMLLWQHESRCIRCRYIPKNEFRNRARKGDFGENASYKNKRPFKPNNVGLLDSEDVTGIYFKRLQRRKNSEQK